MAQTFTPLFGLHSTGTNKVISLKKFSKAASVLLRVLAQSFDIQIIPFEAPITTTLLCALQF
jgi:hypothetical protein